MVAFSLDLDALPRHFAAMSEASGNQDYCFELVRTSDHERYLTTLFAPRAYRRSLWTLLAFNQEVAKIREAVNENSLGQIRLKWWQEVLGELKAGHVRKQPVIEELAVLKPHSCVWPLLNEALEARVYEMTEDAGTFEALEAYACGTGGALHEAMYQICSNEPSSSRAVLAARSAGAAWAMMGIIRALPFHWQADQSLLPQSDAAAMQLRNSAHVFDAIKPTVDKMVAFVQSQMRVVKEHHREVPKDARSSILCASLAQQHLKALENASGNPFEMIVFEAGDLRKINRLVWSFLSGRV